MKVKLLAISVTTALLTACGGGDQAPPPSQPKVAVPQLTVSAIKGSVANPATSTTAKYSASHATRSATTSFDKINTVDCTGAMNLANIYSVGWDEMFKKGLTSDQIQTLTGFYGIHLAEGRVEFSPHSAKPVAAKDWISYFYYTANFQECIARERGHDSITKGNNGITELRLKYTVEASQNTPLQTHDNYTAWQEDTVSKDVTGLVTTFTTGDIQSKDRLKSYRWDTGRAVDFVSANDMFKHSYFFEEYDNNEVTAQIVGGKLIDHYGKANASDPTKFYAINLISAHFPGVGTQVSWCIRGSEYADNKETAISEAKFKQIVSSGNLDTAYCDPFDPKIGKTRFYDTHGDVVAKDSAIANELSNKLASGTVEKDKLDKLVNNKALYSGKSQQEYFQQTSLANQVDQIKADLQP
ncbi:hypothetical protein [Photobacterium kagoshimensis]|uniref:hypothetical protein n=1 Tax=Photobacterium kagoshimensis TaxID=2910242 RepID=UPI003D0AEB8E